MELEQTHIRVCKMQVQDVGVKNSAGLTEYANLSVTHILNRIWSIYYSDAEQRAKVRQPGLIKETESVFKMDIM